MNISFPNFAEPIVCSMAVYYNIKNKKPEYSVNSGGCSTKRSTQSAGANSKSSDFLRKNGIHYVKINVS